MATLSWNMFDSFPADLSSGLHDLNADTLKLAFCTVAPSSSFTQFSELTEISSAGSYSAGGYIVSTTASQGPPFTITFASAVQVGPSGDSWDPFRYIVLYNNSGANSPLISWYDYLSDITLNDGDQIQIDDVSTILSVSGS